MFGFYARGSDGHLIIGDDHPVLCQKYTGRIVMNRQVNSGYDYQPVPVSYGYCEVSYPEPIRDHMPPMVFGVPTATCSNKGIGLFQHRGGPGNWTGFSIVVTRTLFLDNNSSINLGFDSGWEYRVCVFGDPGVNRSGSSNYGLNLFDKDGRPTFSSNWPFVPFRGVLSGWRLSSFTRWYSPYRYWFNAEVSGANTDYVLAKGTHAWGATDGRLGMLISSLGCIPVRADVGRSRDHTQDSVVLMGFPDSSRSNIWSVTVYGLAQHPSANMNAMNSWRILTADFTYV